MPSLLLGLAVVAAFLLGLRAGIGIGQRAERRRREDPRIVRAPSP